LYAFEVQLRQIIDLGSIVIQVEQFPVAQIRWIAVADQFPFSLAHCFVADVLPT